MARWRRRGPSRTRPSSFGTSSTRRLVQASCRTAPEKAPAPSRIPRFGAHPNRTGTLDNIVGTRELTHVSLFGLLVIDGVCQSHLIL